MATQIVFVGHHKKRLLDSIRALREFPVSKVLLVVGQQESSGEKKARRVAEELARELKTVWDVEVVEVDKKDVVRAAFQLISLIRKEGEVVLNISGSLRTFAVAAYIAACVTGSKIITSIPLYDENDEEVGVEEVIEIPVLPINFPGKEQLEILLAIEGGVDSLDELILRLKPNVNSKELSKERSRVSHHLSKLEKAGLVKRLKVGKNVKIELTNLGKIVVASFDTSYGRENLEV